MSSSENEIYKLKRELIFSRELVDDLRKEKSALEE